MNQQQRQQRRIVYRMAARALVSALRSLIHDIEEHTYSEEQDR